MSFGATGVRRRRAQVHQEVPTELTGWGEADGLARGLASLSQGTRGGARVDLIYRDLDEVLR
jgi:hypothetical protein